MARLEPRAPERARQAVEPPRAMPTAPPPAGPAIVDRPSSRPAPPSAPEAEPPGSADDRALHDRARRFVAYTQEAVRQGVQLDLSGLDRLASAMVDSAGQSQYLLLKALSRGDGFDVAIHSVNVSVFAIKTGIGLGYSRDQLVHLCMAALVHDIGMGKVPNEILTRHGSLSSSEAAQIKQHPDHGREALSALGQDYQWLADVAYEEHERENGQGYPRGLRGNQINEFAKIVGVADIFEAFSHPRTFRKTFVANEALQKLISMKGEFFDARVIKALMSEISMFPLGTYVQLNTDEVGKVIATNSNNVLKPVVAVLYDHTGARIRQPKTINLEQYPMISILRSLSEEELPK